MSKRDYYEVLGLAKSATEDEIKKAYRKLSSAHHPDKHTDPADKTKHEAIFKEVKEAYEALSDPQKRANYDRHGHSDFQSSGWGRGQSASDMEDILNQMMRGHRGGFHGFRGNFRQVSEMQAPVTLREAMEGFDLQLTDGLGKPTSKVKVKPGTPDGYRTQHDVDQNLTLMVTTRIRDPRFTIKTASECGNYQEAVNGQLNIIVACGDIETTITTDALDLLIGAWTEVEGIQGEKLQVRVPAGLQVNQRLKVKGQGYYHWNYTLDKPHTRGDLYVKVVPRFDVPRNLDVEKVTELHRQVMSYQPGAGGIDTKV